MTGPWRGQDPLLRWLRVLSIIAFLVLAMIVVLDPARDNIALDALLVGAVLIQLGYDVALKLPEIVGAGRKGENVRGKRRLDDDA